MKKNTPDKDKKKSSKIIKKKKDGYDQYGERKNEKIDYEKDRPPHW